MSYFRFLITHGVFYIKGEGGIFLIVKISFLFNIFLCVFQGTIREDTSIAAGHQRSPSWGPRLALISLPRDDPPPCVTLMGTVWTSRDPMGLTGPHQWTGVKYPSLLVLQVRSIHLVQGFKLSGYRGQN